MIASEILIDLEKILQSTEFKESKRYQDLFKYLVEESLKGSSLKESTIAHDIFGKDSKFDSTSDPSIRVYISNLRKKIEYYYLTTSDNYSTKFEIPKGHYSVKFIPVSKENPIIPKRNNLVIYLICIIFILTCIVLYQYLFSSSEKYSSQEIYKKNPVWNEFIQPNSKPTMIVLGDYLFLFEKNVTNPSGGLFVRDGRINSEEDYRELIKKNPLLINKYVLLNFTYMRPSTAWGLTEILPILWNSPNKVFLKLASQLKWEDLKTHNVIFIGSFKTLYKLKQLIPQFNIKYSIAPSALYITKPNGDTVKSFNPQNLKGGNYIKDYGLVVKQSGPENNTILFLLGFDEVGLLEAARSIADPKLLDRLKNSSLLKSSNDKIFFEMILEAEGVEQTGFKSEIKFFQEFTPKSSPQF